MAEYTKDEALTFIEAMRLTLSGKVGFKWLTEKLSDLAAYIESITAENERLNAYVDSVGSKADYEAYCSTHPSVPKPGDTGEEG
jgi:hypothetical protein